MNKEPLWTEDKGRGGKLKTKITKKDLFSEVFIPKTSSANGAKTAVFLILQFMYGWYV